MNAPQTSRLHHCVQDSTSTPKSNHTFTFRQFQIRQERSAMKVGTDGVLLGAWTEVDGRDEVLDVGCGTGVIALMLAQRNPSARVTAIDIDPTAAEEARENILASPFASRIEVVQKDFAQFTDRRTFTLIVSNPPFYTEDTHNPDARRNQARHTSSLPYSTLLQGVSRLLAPEGIFSLIIPTSQCQSFIGDAACHGLFLRRRTDVCTTPRKPAKRTLLTFVKQSTPTTATHQESSTLILQTLEGTRTAEYAALTHDFYL